jgi:hypothetical protein
MHLTTSTSRSHASRRLRFPVCIRALLLFSSIPFVAYAQEVTHPSQYTQGPLSFTRMTACSYTETAQRIVEGIVYHDFVLTSPTGYFEYTTDNGSVVGGNVTNLHLEGSYSTRHESAPETLTVAKGKLSFTILTNKTFSLIQYGGMVTIPPKTNLLLANPEDIVVTGDKTLNQQGALSISTFNTVSWRGVQISLPQLPNAFGINLSSIPAAESQFLLPLDTAHLSMTKGSFAYVKPVAARSQPFDITEAGYNLHIGRLSVSSWTATVSKSSVSMIIKDLAGEGEFVGAAITQTSKIPVLFAGDVSAESITASAPYSERQIQIQAPEIAGLRLKHVITKGATLNARVPAAKSSHENATQKQAATEHVPSVAPQIDSVAATQTQNAAIKQLGMATLSDDQEAAVAAGVASLKLLDTPGFLINYPAAGISSLLSQAVTLVGIPELRVGHVTFGKQQVLLSGSLSISTSIPVTYLFEVSPSIESATYPISSACATPQQKLILRYSLSEVSLGDANAVGPLSPTDIQQSITTGVTQASTAAPSDMKCVALPTDFTKPLNWNKSYTDPTSGAVISVSSPQGPSLVKGTVSAVSSVLLVDEQGIHIMGGISAK